MDSMSLGPKFLGAILLATIAIALAAFLGGGVLIGWLVAHC